MYELKIYDSDGNSIREFTQWDIGVTIKIKGAFDRLPSVHFFNEKMKKAYPVTPVSAPDGIMAEVPDVLLVQPYPVHIYVYDEDVSSSTDFTGRSIFSTRVPVRMRNKPIYYTFSDNVKVVNINMLENEVEVFLDDANRQEQERVEQELERQDNEDERQANEADRISNENARQDAELLRANAERIRNIHEEYRIANEEERIETFNELVEGATAATDRANDAADRVDDILIPEMSRQIIAFTEAEEREGINTNESLSTMFGKIQKYLNDFEGILFDDITEADIDALFE